MNEIEIKLQEIQKDLDKMDTYEDKYKQDTTKYFDRINDKLFYLNNIYIAVYFALVAFKSTTPKYILLFPLCNSVLLLFIEWKMMESMRKMSRFKNMTKVELDIENKKLDHTNLLGLSAIVITLIVTGCLFGYVWYYV